MPSSLEQIVDGLAWLIGKPVVGQTGLVLAVLAVLGYMFREKWKQILRRSLSADLERLKAELQRASAEHAASLAPQIEAIKAEFQQKVEAYKVSLIAEAEHAKAQSELRKAIALKHATNEFDRLCDLEAAFDNSSIVLVRAEYPAELRSIEDVRMCLDQGAELSKALSRAHMFLPQELNRRLHQYRRDLHTALTQNVGPRVQPIPEERSRVLLETHVELAQAVRAQIHNLARLRD